MDDKRAGEMIPAVVLWNFRVAALGMQVVVWGTFGLVFGPLAERLLVANSRSMLKRA